MEAEDQSSSSKSNKDETTSAVSSDEMTIDSPPILPAAQPTRPEVEEEGKLQVDDLSIQIRANKSEVSDCSFCLVIGQLCSAVLTLRFIQ